MFVIAFKVALESLIAVQLIRSDRLAFFRTHYLGYMAVAFLRTLIIGFFMIVFLAMVQFSHLEASAPLAVACLGFACMVFTLGTLCGAVIYTRITSGESFFNADRQIPGKRKTGKSFFKYTVLRESKSQLTEIEARPLPIGWWKVRPRNAARSVHDDVAFTKRFGWLVSRYRATRWWFFVVLDSV